VLSPVAVRAARSTGRAIHGPDDGQLACPEASPAVDTSAAVGRRRQMLVGWRGRSLVIVFLVAITVTAALRGLT
jgi:hypothetical protein